MIRSMTGFGRSELLDENKKIVIEIKSVNHRYSDISIKMPRKFNQFEPAMRNVLKDYIVRGKVDVFVTYEDFAKSNLMVKYNKEIASEYINYLEQMRDDFGLKEELRPTVVADFPEVFSLEEKSEIDESLYKDIEKTLREAGESFSNARAMEGENLKKKVLPVIKDLGLTGFCQALMWVLGEVFYMPQKQMLDEPDERRGRFLLSEVMRAGNFGHADERVGNWAEMSRWERLTWGTRWSWRLIGQYPREVFWHPYYRITQYIWRLINGYL